MTLNPQVWADGFAMDWYLSPDNFYSDYPIQLNKLAVGQGDGTTVTFAFDVPQFPILAGSLYVTDGTQVAVDNGSGGFTAPSSGSIDYASGSVSVTFPVAPVANANITETSQTYMANRPIAILYYPSAPLGDATAAAITNNNTFVLRPVPDQVYQIKLQGINTPTPMVNYTDVPFRPDLGPLIALGASLHIFKVFNQLDQYEQYVPEYQRFKDVSMQDTYEEYLYQRSVPQF